MPITYLESAFILVGVKLTLNDYVNDDMTLNLRTQLVLLLLLLMAGCKTPESTKYYEPIFDQTNKTYASTPSNRVALDTSVLIRSNLIENSFAFIDTITIEEVFQLESAELAVPLELINEKPPVFDTFLVVNDFRFSAKYVDLVFPVIPVAIIQEMIVDSMNSTELNDGFSDSNNSGNSPASMKKEEIEKKNSRMESAHLTNKEKRKANKSRKEIDKILQAKQKKMLEVELVRESGAVKPGLNEELLNGNGLNKNNGSDLLNLKKEVKSLYSKEEILADTTRDLLDAETILNDLVNEAAWKKGDSIPVFSVMNNYFLDSSLVILYDTVYVEFFDSTRIIPQLTYTQLTDITLDTVKLNFEFLINEILVFKVFHPDMDDVYVDMIRIQGGDFKMGSNEFDDDERPAYSIHVSSYFLSKYEITNKLFCYFLNDKLCDQNGQIDGILVIDLNHPDTKIKRNKFTGKFTTVDGFDEYPVINVSWVGAQMFCKSAGGRLPSEAEWEYAAKGGIYARKFYTNADKTDFDYVNRFAGGNFMGDLGWFVDNSRGQIWVGGRKLPNELSLFDMNGNVWEWCYDQYSKDFYRRNNRSKNPMCLDGGTLRVNRGGSWSSDALYCRVTNRNFLSQYEYNPYLGFRLMREWK